MKLAIYIVFVIVTGITTYFTYGYVQSSKYADTAIPYLQEVLPQISTWDADGAKQYMVPEILQTITPDNLKNLMAALSVIGNLESIGEASFKNKVSGDEIQFIDSVVITYDVDAKYSSGDAVVTIRLLVRNDSYEVYNFNFKTQALAVR